MGDTLDPKPSLVITEEDGVLTTRFPADRTLAPVWAACLFAYLSYTVFKLAHSFILESWVNQHLPWWKWVLLVLLLVLLFAVLARLAWACIVTIGSDHEILQVTPTQLSITRVTFGKARKTRSFDTSAIANMRFAEVGIGRYGSTFAFRFEYRGEKIKFFQGARAVDADMLLPKLLKRS